MASPIPNRTPSERELQWFGLIVLVVFGMLGSMALWRFDALGAAQVLWSLGAGIALGFYALRPLRRPIYGLWMRLTTPIGWAISNLVLAIIFYGLITPLGLVMRLFGRDKLERRFEPAAESYWVAHDPGGDTARYFRQS